MTGRSDTSLHDGLIRFGLKQQLYGLPFPALLAWIRLLLVALGYSVVEPGNRRHWRGRTKLGGADLEAVLVVAASRSRIFIQVKRNRHPVSRRFIDELRGTMARHGATHGLILATGRFSPVAVNAARSDRLAPIRLVEGEELIDWMFRNEVGVVRDAKNNWQIDSQFFRKLTIERAGPSHSVRYSRQSIPGAIRRSYLNCISGNGPTRRAIQPIYLVAVIITALLVPRFVGLAPWVSLGLISGLVTAIIVVLVSHGRR
jgi:hypothetical protein